MDEVLKRQHHIIVTYPSITWIKYDRDTLHIHMQCFHLYPHLCLKHLFRPENKQTFSLSQAVQTFLLLKVCLSFLCLHVVRGFVFKAAHQILIYCTFQRDWNCVGDRKEAKNWVCTSMSKCAVSVKGWWRVQRFPDRILFSLLTSTNSQCSTWAEELWDSRLLSFQYQKQTGLHQNINVSTSELKQPEQPSGCHWSKTDVSSFAQISLWKFVSRAQWKLLPPVFFFCCGCIFFFFSSPQCSVFADWLLER